MEPKNKDILELKNNINLMELTDVYRVFHPIIAQCTFFSAVHGNYS
jgi:hypothetical protein